MTNLKTTTHAIEIDGSRFETTIDIKHAVIANLAFMGLHFDEEAARPPIGIALSESGLTSLIELLSTIRDQVRASKARMEP